jgi:DNA primase
VVTLEAGLDPDRFIRERGIRAYVAAVEGARRHSDYLLDRAIQLYPPRDADGKTKALNFLLPHIRRMPNKIARDEFASDAAQKLGINTALLREELHEAARKRRDQVQPSGHDSLTEAERVLIRAASAPSQGRICLCVGRALEAQPHYFEDLSVTPMLQSLVRRGEVEPLAAVPDPRQRTLLAQVLFRETSELELEQVEAALHSLRYRRLESLQRRVRTDIAEAERRGDWVQVAASMAEKVKIDREMREVDG